MNRISQIKKRTGSRFLSYYDMDVIHRDGTTAPYYMVSRSSNVESLKAVTHASSPDGVIIYGLYDDKIVLIKQYRYPLGDYIYEFPAGLLEPGEDILQAAIREMFEETGLTLVPLHKQPASSAYYTSVGMSDECCSTVFGTCTGNPSTNFAEASEDIQIVLADRNECRRILREENVAIVCAYMLMHFIADPEPFSFIDSI